MAQQHGRSDISVMERFARSLSLAPRAGYCLYITRESLHTPPIINLEHILHLAFSPFYIGVFFTNPTRNPVNLPSLISSPVLSHSPLSWRLSLPPGADKDSRGQGCRLVPVIHLQEHGQGRQSSPEPPANTSCAVLCSQPKWKGFQADILPALFFVSGVMK